MTPSKELTLPVKIRRSQLHRFVVWSIPVVRRIPILNRIILRYLERVRFLSIKVGSGPWKKLPR